MNPLWLISALVLLVGGTAVFALLRSTAEEARLLSEELGRLGQVRSSLARLRTSLEAGGSPLRRRR